MLRMKILSLLDTFNWQTLRFQIYTLTDKTHKIKVNSIKLIKKIFTKKKLQCKLYIAENVVLYLAYYLLA